MNKYDNMDVDVERLSKNIGSVLKEKFTGDISKFETTERLRDYVKRTYPSAPLRVVEPEQVIDHLERLKLVDPETAKNLKGAHEKKRENEEDSVNDSLNERIVLRYNEMLDIEALDRGKQVSSAVGRVVVDNGADQGTGFLVGNDILLTNRHVLKDAALASKSHVVMNDNRASISEHLAGSQVSGVPIKTKYKLDPKTFFFAGEDEHQDFAFVAVKNRQVKHGKGLADYATLPLFEQTSKILIGHSVNIIHHPNGETKKISMHMSFLTELNDDDTDAGAVYTGDTLPGSSGAPVMNLNWEVIALHRRGIPEIDPKTGKVVLKNDQQIDRALINLHEEDVKWIANSGLRTSHIVKALMAKTFNTDGFEEVKNNLLSYWADTIS